jgi:hypothetical protein
MSHLVRNGHTPEVRKLSDGPHRKAAMNHAVVHNHIGDSKEGDSEAKAEAKTTCYARGEKTVRAQGDRRNGIHDSVDVVGLERSRPGLVVRLMQRPARLELVPQDPVGIPRIHFHAKLSSAQKIQIRTAQL